MLQIIAAITWLNEELTKLGLSADYLEKAITIAWTDLKAGKTKELILDELKLLFSSVQLAQP